LRECLKQERLNPVPVEFQLAWLIAYNDGLFDGREPGTVAGALEDLRQWLRSTDLNLDSPRQRWTDALASWAKAESR
jgi:F-type H+-transporting ATPase subunit alpha